MKRNHAIFLITLSTRHITSTLQTGYQRYAAQRFSASLVLSCRISCTQRTSVVRCPAHPDRMNSRCPAHPVRVDSHCPAHTDRADSHCPAHPDIMDSRCPAHPDRMDSRCPAHPGRMDSRCPAVRHPLCTASYAL